MTIIVASVSFCSFSRLRGFWPGTLTSRARTTPPIKVFTPSGSGVCLGPLASARILCHPVPFFFPSNNRTTNGRPFLHFFSRRAVPLPSLASLLFFFFFPLQACFFLGRLCFHSTFAFFLRHFGLAHLSLFPYPPLLYVGPRLLLPSFLIRFPVFTKLPPDMFPLRLGWRAWVCFWGVFFWAFVLSLLALDGLFDLPFIAVFREPFFRWPCPVSGSFFLFS